MKAKVIFSAGGTGGHLFPAQAVAQALPTCESLFVAGGLSTSRYFDRHLFAYREISCATFSFSKPVKLSKGLIQIGRGFRQSLKIIRDFQPDLVVGFGSYFTLPLLLAAKWSNIPIILHEQNAIPGKVNRLASRFAEATAITFPHAAQFLKGKVKEVAFPLRKKSQEKVDFGLDSKKPILLIFGGSQGAVRLNELVLECAAELKGFQILHFTGNEERTAEIQQHYEKLGIVHCVKPFEPCIDQALEIADLAITRAGASTIAELIEMQTPAILIPFPFATENHQVKNGEYFMNEVGGGELYLEETLDGEKLLQAIHHFPFEEKKQNIEEYKKKRQLNDFSKLIMETVNDK